MPALKEGYLLPSDLKEFQNSKNKYPFRFASLLFIPIYFLEPVEIENFDTF